MISSVRGTMDLEIPSVICVSVEFHNQRISYWVRTDGLNDTQREAFFDARTPNRDLLAAFRLIDAQEYVRGHALWGPKAALERYTRLGVRSEWIVSR